jgi:hypothetical protein
MPELSSVAVANSVPLSRKLIDPVGTTLTAPLIWAVKVTFCPLAAGLLFEVNVADVLVTTDSVVGDEVEPA